MVVIHAPRGCDGWSREPAFIHHELQEQGMGMSLGRDVGRSAPVSEHRHSEFEKFIVVVG